MKKQLMFTRVSGAGNTFFILNLENDFLSQWKKLGDTEKGAITKQLSQLKGIINTDGFLTIEKKSQDIFRWEFFNSDGSSAEMCGNAARCVGKYIFERELSGSKKIFIQTLAGLVEVQKRSETSVSVQMNSIKNSNKLNVVLSDGRTISGIFVDTGVPHFVTDVLLSKEECKQIRWNKCFFSNGTNVTMILNPNDSNVSAISFERGVENFTASCGTGAVAAAFWMKENKNKKKNIEVQMPGGCLTVEWFLNENTPILVGPAEIHFDILLDLEAF